MRSSDTASALQHGHFRYKAVYHVGTLDVEDYTWIYIAVKSLRPGPARADNGHTYVKSILAAVAMTASVAAVSAAGPPPARVAARAAATSARSTSVMGAAWNQDNAPIPGARLQLRNLVSGKLAGTTVADEAGRFSFSNIEGGTYVVELVGTNGKIVTVGHAFVIAPGEAVATFVRLGSKVPWFNGFFSNSAAAAASSAASQGITALAPVQLPLSAPGSGSQ